MAIVSTEKTAVTVSEDGVINVKKWMRMTDESTGAFISDAPAHERRVVNPGDDLTSEVPLVKEVGSKVHTAARKNAFAEKVAAARAADAARFKNKEPA